jgi:hypothetical protein
VGGELGVVRAMRRDANFEGFVIDLSGGEVGNGSSGQNSWAG